MVENMRTLFAVAVAALLVASGVDAAASGKYPCVATCGSLSSRTPQCGASTSDATNNACGTSSASYEGCTTDVCDVVCGGSTSVTTAAAADFPVTVNSGGVQYKCFDADDLMHMMEPTAKMQSVAMNCNTAGTTDGTAHTMTMNGMTEYMAGGMDHACENWVVGAANGAKSSVFAFALAGAAVAAAL